MRECCQSDDVEKGEGGKRTAMVRSELEIISERHRFAQQSIAVVDGAGRGY